MSKINSYYLIISYINQKIKCVIASDLFKRFYIHITKLNLYIFIYINIIQTYVIVHLFYIHIRYIMNKYIILYFSNFSKYSCENWPKVLDSLQCFKAVARAVKHQPRALVPHVFHKRIELNILSRQHNRHIYVKSRFNNPQLVIIHFLAKKFNLFYISSKIINEDHNLKGNSLPFTGGCEISSIIVKTL